ncbi:MAG: hypothetical protein M0017_10680 [Desulfobacteraceae bacterium]|nr:hypothetical protein [Desulfobacteraceae bacterium]
MAWKKILSLMIPWLAFTGAYLLYAGTLDYAEAAAGGMAAAASAALFHFVRVRLQVPLSLEARWLSALFRLPGAIAWEALLISSVFLKRMAGRRAGGVFMEYDYPPMGPDKRDSALRAYAAYGVCVSPNSYLAAYDKKQKRAVVHQLAGRELSASDRSFLDLR